MRVQIESAFDAVGRDAWDALVRKDSRATVSQSWGWQRAWWRTFHDAAAEPRELLLVAVHGDTGLRALAPLMIERQGGRRVVRFVGDGHAGHADHADVIATGADDEARALILDTLHAQAHRWDRLDLAGLPERSPTIALLNAWAARHRRDARTTRAAYAVLPTNVGVPAERARSDDLRGIEITHTVDPQEIAAQLNAFFVQHIHAWSAGETPSPFVLRANRDFYRHLVADLGTEAGGVILSAASAGGAPLALSVGFLFGQRLWCERAADPLHTEAHADSALVRALVAVARERALGEVVLDRRDGIPADVGMEVRHRVAVRVTAAAAHPWAGSVRRLTGNRITQRVLTLTSELKRVADVAANAPRMVEAQRNRASAAVSHKDFYDAGNVTRQYVHATQLQKPEQTILGLLRAELPRMSVLDVAVGGGRTVPYFGTLAREYRAFDFAPNMVTGCQQIVGDLVDPSCITWGDARNMSDVADASCDLVLISYNAIDDMGGETERLGVLAEMRRVAAPDGYFCLSSHNLRSLTPDGANGIVPRMRRWRRYQLLRAANPKLRDLRDAPSAMINDAGADYRFPHYYIRPSAQVRQLEAAGFTNVRVFSVDTGAEVRDASRWDTLTDSWVYYLCRA
jgi:SAM-dependent methyltransferase